MNNGDYFDLFTFLSLNLYFPHIVRQMQKLHMGQNKLHFHQEWVRTCDRRTNEMKETTIRNISFLCSFQHFIVKLTMTKHFYSQRPFCLLFSLFMRDVNGNDILYMNLQYTRIQTNSLEIFNRTKNVNCDVGVKGFLFLCVFVSKVVRLRNYFQKKICHLKRITYAHSHKIYPENNKMDGIPFQVGVSYVQSLRSSIK